MEALSDREPDEQMEELSDREHEEREEHVGNYIQFNNNKNERPNRARTVRKKIKKKQKYPS